MKFCALHDTHEYWLNDGRCGYCADAVNGRKNSPIDIVKETGCLWFCIKHSTHRYWRVGYDNIDTWRKDGVCGYCADETPKPMRPSIDQYFMTIAHAVATRATCPRASVGAVLYRDGYQVACGFNGSPHGLPHCTEAGCLMIDGHCMRAVHAEINAIVHAARLGVSTEGCTLAVTHYPCLPCALPLINAGIVRVVYANEYRRSHALQFFVDAGVDVVQL